MLDNRAPRPRGGFYGPQASSGRKVAATDSCQRGGSPVTGSPHEAVPGGLGEDLGGGRGRGWSWRPAHALGGAGLSPPANPAGAGREVYISKKEKAASAHHKANRLLEKLHGNVQGPLLDGERGTGRHWKDTQARQTLGRPAGSLPPGLFGQNPETGQTGCQTPALEGSGQTARSRPALLHAGWRVLIPTPLSPTVPKATWVPHTSP